jgi:hypothetical protein
MPKSPPLLRLSPVHAGARMAVHDAKLSNNMAREKPAEVVSARFGEP